jgi:hypothetical protein
VTTASIDNDLYSAIQNQAIREAKSDHSKDGDVAYRESQPFVVNNQNWEIDTTESGTVAIGFPCVSQWWYTPIEVYDDIAEPLDRLVEGDADKTRLQVYRRGDDWFCTFNIEYDTDPSGETPIGVDIGECHILAATAYGEGESNRATSRAEEPAVVDVRCMRGGRPLAGLYALESTSLVTTGRRPLTAHAKASLRPEETRNLNIPFGNLTPLGVGGCQT